MEQRPIEFSGDWLIRRDAEDAPSAVGAFAHAGRIVQTPRADLAGLLGAGQRSDRLLQSRLGFGPLGYVYALDEDAADPAPRIVHGLIDEIQQSLAATVLAMGKGNRYAGSAIRLTTGIDRIEPLVETLPGDFGNRLPDRQTNSSATGKGIMRGIGHRVDVVGSLQQGDYSRRLGEHPCLALMQRRLFALSKHPGRRFDNHGQHARRPAVVAKDRRIVEVHEDLLRQAVAVQRHLLVAVGQGPAGEPDPHHGLVEVGNLRPVLTDR